VLLRHGLRVDALLRLLVDATGGAAGAAAQLLAVRVAVVAGVGGLRPREGVVGGGARVELLQDLVGEARLLVVVAELARSLCWKLSVSATTSRLGLSCDGDGSKGKLVLAIPRRLLKAVESEMRNSCSSVPAPSSPEGNWPTG